jgi:hypothetical protein
MRVAVPHSLPREEVRRRLREQSGEIANFIPGGMAQVTSNWTGEDRMQLSVAAMGANVTGDVMIEDTQVVFQVTLPPALSFFEPMVAKAIAANGQKLLTKA